MVETTKKSQPSSTKVKVKNISKRTINLTGESIEPGKEGIATIAECINHSKTIQKVAK